MLCNTHYNREIDPASVMVAEIVNTVKGGGHVVAHGVGREGLLMKGLCMRLFHLGLNTICVGDMAAPAVARGDLLIGSASPGNFSTVNAIFRQAKEAGARVLLLTARPEGSYFFWHEIGETNWRSGCMRSVRPLAVHPYGEKRYESHERFSVLGIGTEVVKY